MEALAGDRKIGRDERRGRLRTIALLFAGAAIIAGIAGAAFYRDQVAPFRTKILIVDGRSVDMEYFLKRVRLSGDRPLAVLPQLAVEEIITATAPRPPYSIAVTDADIEAALVAMAGGNEQSGTGSEHEEWYRQQLNESGLTDGEYRELVRARLLGKALADYLAERVPTVAEQIRLQVIVQPTLNDANAVKARLDAGEDFADLAMALNVDETLKAQVGELGWFPRAALMPNLARTAFDVLEVGEVGGPVPIGGSQFAIVRVAGRAAAMQIDEKVLKSIKARVLDVWAEEELRKHQVEYRGFDGGYDSETNAWVIRQLGNPDPAGGFP